MTPEQIKKHEPMNINNFYEAVPVNKELPPNTNDDFFCIYTDCRKDCRSGMYISYYQKNIEFWYRPVTRESIEAFMREVITGGHVKLITEMAIIAATKETNVIDVDAGVSVSEKLVSNLITELINKTLGQ